MKQLRNIFTGLLFALGLLVSLPALAQEEITHISQFRCR